jgi:aldehyde dehydrogenase (NAD+)
MSDKHLSSPLTANGKVITSVAEGTSADVDTAVAAARKAFQTTWGLNTEGFKRGALLWKIAEVMETHALELAALECLDNGKTWSFSTNIDVDFSIKVFQYYAGWADKNQGKVSEVGSYSLDL